MLTRLFIKLFGDGLLLQVFGILIRQGITVLSAYLLTLGLNEEVVTQFITSGEQILIALAGILAAFLMSVANKHRLL